MALSTKNSANVGFVRRFYAEPYVTATTTNDYEPVIAFPIIKMDSVVIIPFTNTEGASVDLDISVSYDEPKYANGEFISEEDNETEIDPELFQYRLFKSVTISRSSGAIDDDKIVISQFNTGISAIKINARSSTQNRPAELGIYIRGYHIQR